MLIRYLTIMSLLLTAACGQEAAEDAPAAPAAAAAPALPPAAAPAAAALQRRSSPAAAAVYFIEPVDGAVVANPVRIVFGLRGAGIAPAGIERDGAGHHHLLIDTELPDLDLPIPADDTHRHFGGGQTETSLELAPGRHTLQLLLADERHIPHEPPIVSERITIEVR
jgi:hypothetical protein